MTAVASVQSGVLLDGDSPTDRGDRPNNSHPNDKNRSTVTSKTTDPTPQEMALVRRILAGEKELYYDLIAPYERAVYVSALAIVRNPADAEDCAQDAFLKAFRHLEAFRGESRFGSWLVRIVLNEAKMKLRKLRPGLYESLDETAGEDSDYIPRDLGDWRAIPSESLELKEVRAVLVQAVEDLPEIYREVFVLRDVQGMNVADTAQLLDVSEAVVKTRLLRARLRMRDMVAPVLKNSSALSRQFFKKGKNPWQ
ncbi:MAG TPA: sigma-70 family RNA polymerase sigma factor [Verrucomicrobiae bacterium]|jgi:RNA polymerase sigma-70 factor (ECF subfamily)|nr:sigma-70 family RNA polymerase sigma factor [Verrucomicrobiae bacterium]